MKTGKVSQAVLDRSVLRSLALAHAAGEGAAFGADCGFFPDALPGSGAAGASLIATLGGRFDRTPQMLVESVENNLAAAGAGLEWMVLHIFYPAEQEEGGLKALMKALAKACGERGITVTGGHTEISRAVTRPVAALTGFGRPERTKENGSGNMPERGKGTEMDLVMSGWAGLAGTAILAEGGRTELLERYPVSLVEAAARFGASASVREAARAGNHFGVSAMHDVSQGGVFGALWELAERVGAGLEVDLKKIPIRQETIEICEFYDLNPYQLYGQGALLFCTERGEPLAGRLRETGIAAEVIGRIRGGNDRIIRNGEETRFLDRPAQDELWRLAEHIF